MQNPRRLRSPAPAVVFVASAPLNGRLLNMALAAFLDARHAATFTPLRVEHSRSRLISRSTCIRTWLYRPPSPSLAIGPRYLGNSRINLSLRMRRDCTTSHRIALSRLRFGAD
ncbi:hypothetical protein K505DRAFT_329320 [Melanomma pulvis-pyrius CBS 109.77]|uniref:Uncharacterized protein n=1 Tax=Melanomma pulvis-pyrius CBS 109.77 TaxID=1314802 RepID=A0A6A6WVK5_9PLEO|nr:hypothetical protein K505DRAFT_329320 [Melanomma pulvis-pyrius CBS 109.77]